MRVLLSAYACEPGKGSEPGVGWNWAIELARAGHEVWVITRKNNESPIRETLAEGSVANLHFIYYDVPKALAWWKKGRRGIHLYYLLWQIGAFLTARALARQKSFDLVHHVTLVSMRQPSFMGLLGLPFVFGPVSGGEEAPRRLLGCMRAKDRLYELFRSAVNRLILIDPLMHLTFATADAIVATSESTRRLVPGLYRRKTRVQLAIGIDDVPCLKRELAGGEFRVLFVGRLLGWKGITLALRAFARLKQQQPQARFTIVGKGPLLAEMLKLERTLGISDSVEHIAEVGHNELQAMYGKYDVFLFPSMRDSGGLVVLEALRSGTPVVCLDQGGPGVIVNDRCGRIVAGNQSPEAVVEQLAASLMEVATVSDTPAELSEAAMMRASEFRWGQLVLGLYDSVHVLHERTEINRLENEAHSS